MVVNGSNFAGFMDNGLLNGNGSLVYGYDDRVNSSNNGHRIRMANDC